MKFSTTSLLFNCTVSTHVGFKPPFKPHDKVALHWAWLVMGWVNMSRFNSQCGTFILVCDQPLRLTQPGHPFVGRHNEYQPKGGDALRLRGKGRYGSCVGGR